MILIRKVASSCEQLCLVFTCLCPKFIKFSFQNSENVEEDKNGRIWTHFSFDNKKKFQFKISRI